MLYAYSTWFFEASTLLRGSRFFAAMARVEKNWEPLVRATLQREQLRSEVRPGGRAPPAGLIASIPSSLGRTTNIDDILYAVDEIQDEDPNVARILCNSCFFGDVVEADGENWIAFAVCFDSGCDSKYYWLGYNLCCKGCFIPVFREVTDTLWSGSHFLHCPYLHSRDSSQKLARWPWCSQSAFCATDHALRHR